MDQRSDEFGARLEGLAREVAELRRRVDRLDAAARTADASGDPTSGSTGPEAGATRPVAGMIPDRTTPLVGRTLVVLGGAYLLRAITETGVVPPLGGAIAGLVYAAWWFIQVERAAAAGDRTGAAFHGFAAVLIAYPLVWETTVRFDVLGTPAAATALGVAALLGLLVAWRSGIAWVAWSTTLAAAVTAIGLMVGTTEFLPFAVALLVLGVGVEALAFLGRWLSLRVLAAIAIDLGILMMTSAATARDPGVEDSRLLLVSMTAAALALPVLYLGSIAARTLLRARVLTWFEIVQVPLALVVGLTSAARLLSAGGIEPGPIGALAVLLGAACYAAAFTSIDRGFGRGRNFHTYASLAGLLVLAGAYGVLPGALLSLTWAALAVGALVLGTRFDRITLRFHGAVYVVAASMASGLLGAATDGLAADADATWRPVTLLGLLVGAIAAGCYAILLATPAPRPGRGFELLPRGAVAAVVVWSLAGISAPWIYEVILHASGLAPDAAFLACSRTGVGAVGAVALAWIGRRASLEELTWLVYPVLVAGGAKLLWEDFQYGRPVTLFAALALYGGALILTPRMLRRESSTASSRA